MTTKTKSINWAEVKETLARNQQALEKALLPNSERVDAIYQRRAVQLAGRKAEVIDPGANFAVQVFLLGRQRYGIQLSELVEVLPLVKCTPVPGAPPEVIGVVNVRGEIRTVLDLARLLILNELVNAGPSFVLMIRKATFEVGLRVDQIEEIQSVATADLTLPGSGAPELSPRYVKGLTPDKLILLSAEAIFSHELFNV